MCEEKYGCIVDLDPCEMPRDCVFDNDEPIENCGVAIRLRDTGKGKTDCEYWVKIEQPEDPVENYKRDLVEWLEKELRAKSETVFDGGDVAFNAGKIKQLQEIINHIKG